MTTVKINIDSVDKMLRNRGLEPKGKVQKFMTSEIARLSNPYVPFKTGALKDIQVEVLPNMIKYKAPYAKKQYYTNSGMGKQGLNNGGLRGKLWTERMWADKGISVVKSVANYAGGKVK